MLGAGYRGRPLAQVLTLPLLLIAGCGGVESGTPDREPGASDAGTILSDETAASGLDFVHINGVTGRFYYSEMMGAGAALFDYDGDGDLDLYLVQGGMLEPGRDPAESLLPVPAAMLPPRDRLYRNDLEVVRGDLTVTPSGDRRLVLTDVTTASGLEPSGAYGMGAATGDYDNDGDVDLYVTAAGANRLLRNDGDGTFSDVTAASGTDDRRWSTSAAWLDYDRDGWLDLYLVNYVDFTPATHQPCRSLTGALDYCGPLAYRPQRDRLFRNRGDGSFEDATVKAQLAGELGAGMGVVSGDFDDDGWPDLYVANDGMPNVMWMNRGDGTFVNRALEGGSALNREGQAEAGMGIAAGDYDGDGDEDLLVTHLALETNTLYRNQGSAFFTDDSVPSELGPPSWRFTGFGTAWLDYDNDGWLDLLAVNGGVKVIPELADEGDPHPLGMRNQLFRNLGTGASDAGPVFAEVSELAGPAFAMLEVSRGLAIGDLDNDGDVDAVVTNNGGPARVLINRVGQRAAWLGLELRTRPGLHAIGASVSVDASVETANRLYRRVRTDGSYLSASDPRLVIGLGGRRGGGGETIGVVVRWPSGRRERFSAAAERYTALVEGEGERIDGDG